MPVNICLIILTLATAVTGTLWNANKWTKVLLVTIAVAVSVVSVFKSVEDEKSSAFLKALVIANLTPIPAAYDHFANEIAKLDLQGFNEVQGQEFGNEPGTVLFLGSQGGRHCGVLVLDPSETATMYANYVQRASDSIQIRSYLSRTIDPRNLNDDFESRVGLLETALVDYLTTKKHDIFDSNQEDGVWLDIYVGERQGRLIITADELRSLQPGPASSVFLEIARKLVPRLKKIATDTSGNIGPCLRR